MPTGIVPCVVRRLSKAGAQIELSEPELIPEEFWLVIKPELIRRHCCLVGKDGLTLSVKFI